MNKIKHPKEKAFFFLGVLLYAGLLALLDSPCILRVLLRIPCPGCGMTRALLSVLRLDFGAAFRYHPLWPLTPLAGLYFLFDGRLFGRVVDRIVLTLLVLLLLAVWILRLSGVLPPV